MFNSVCSFLLSFVSADVINPTKIGYGFFGYMWDVVGNWFVALWRLICEGFYMLCKWLLAFVDFLQYFIQKLIGLDYWLNNSVYTMEGATNSDLLFRFLYNDTVQRVFQTMVAVFIVLLIIFTIYAIIKNEWTYITGNNFGDGKTNSKASIFRSALKAIVLVLIFPIMLIAGIISSNAILASLVKALNIDMSSTFGGTIFYIASQQANKFRLYAQNDSRMPVSDEVSFYMVDHGGTKKYLKLTPGKSGSDDYCVYAATIQEYFTYAKSGTKYSVNSTFSSINPSDTFSGYCISLNINNSTKYFFIKCSDGEKEKEAVYYYLHNVLQVPVMNKTNDIGSRSIQNEVKGNMSNGITSNGFIKDVNLDGLNNSNPAIQAVLNTWNYATLYEYTSTFEEGVNFVAVSQDVLQSYNLGANSAKVMINDSPISSYFDGGQLGIVQMQAEYYVMADVIDFMQNNNLRLYIMDATSELINWNYSSDYLVSTKYVATKSNVTASADAYVDIYGDGDKYLPLIASYSEDCLDTEFGDVLYFAKKGANNELEGSKYIMCFKVQSGTSTEYVPVVNNKTFTDPATKNTYRFSSDFYSSNYQGVVFAKGTFDNSVTGSIGAPTYFKSGYSSNAVGINGSSPYYYDVQSNGSFSQYVEAGNILTEDYKVSSVAYESSSEDSNENYTISIGDDLKTFTVTKDSVAQQLNSNIMQSLKINLLLNQNTKQATYYENNISFSLNNSLEDTNKTVYLFEVDTDDYYFAVIADFANNTFTINGVNTTIDSNGQRYAYIDINNAVAIDSNSTVKAATRQYAIKYDYTKGTINESNITINTLKPNDFEYSDFDNQKGYSVYKTKDVQYISSNNLKTSLYLYSYMDTNSTSIVNLNESFKTKQDPNNQDNYISEFDKLRLDFVGNVKDITYDQVFLKFNLYNFYTFGTTAGSKFEYNYKEGKSGNATEPDGSDPAWQFTCKVNAADFSWNTNANSYALYDGKNYVATIYKNIGTACSGINDLAAVTNSVLYNYKTYYNIRTQNTYTSQDVAKSYYDKLKNSEVISCYRDNFDYKGHWDVSIFWTLRINVSIACKQLTRQENTKTFNMANGVAFDYFFDNNTGVGLSTFFLASKISYWVIIVASILIIKVLGQAIWGVIKRFYEITLYYIAAPAVASTMPIDEKRFTSAIISPLIGKVLSTYGVILGINVFFILLAPVKSMANIFTAEDIATSGSYFLKHLPFGTPSRIASVLNLYVYILFMLVAFTMINSLPTMVTSLIPGGGADVYSEGKNVKESAKGVADSTIKTMNMEGVTNAAGKVKDTVSKNPLVAGVKGLKQRHDNKLNEGRNARDAGYDDAISGTSAAGGDSSGSGGAQGTEQTSSRADDAEEAETVGGTGTVTAENATAQEIASEVEAKTGISEYDQQNGSSIQRTVAEASKIEAGGGETSESYVSSVAEQDFNSSAIDDTDLVGSNKASVIGNVMRNTMGQNQDISRAVGQAIINHQGAAGASAIGETMTPEMQLEALKSTMSNEERENFEKLSADEQKKTLADYSFSASQNELGDLEFKVAKRLDGSDATEEAQIVGVEASNKIKAAMLDAQNIGDEELVTAANQNDVMGVIRSEFGKNIVLGANLSGSESDGGVLDSRVATEALGNDDIKTEAILKYLQSEGKLQEFIDAYHITGKDGKTINAEDIENDAVAKEMALKTIGELSKDTTNQNMINSIDNSAILTQIMNVVKEYLESGKFNLSAWSLAGSEEQEAKKDQIRASFDNNHTILDNATLSERQSIIATTATNIISDDPSGKIAKTIEDVAFASVVSEDELKKLEESGKLLELVKKSSVEELSDEDKAKLGFMKLSSGKELEDIKGTDVLKYQALYSNSSAKAEILSENFTDSQITAAVNTAGYIDVLTRAATLDSSLAISKDKLAETQAEFVLESLDGEALSVVEAKLGESVDDAGKKKVIDLLTSDKGISNLVLSSMKETRGNEMFASIANRNFEVYHPRTREEEKIEHDLSIQAIKEGGTETMFRAFIYNDVENKSAIVDDLISEFTGVEGHVDEILSEKNKIKEEDITYFTSKGLGSREDVALAIQKARMLGQTVNRDNIESILTIAGNEDTNAELNKQLLQKMESMTATRQNDISNNYGREFSVVARDLVENRLTEEDKNSLIERVANCGYQGLSEASQEEFIVSLAKKDGEISETLKKRKLIDAIVAKSYGETNKEEAEKKIDEYLSKGKTLEEIAADNGNVDLSFSIVDINKSQNKDIRERLEALAGSISYYEISQLSSGKSAQDVYSQIHGTALKNKYISDRLATDGGLIGADEIKEQLAHTTDYEQLAAIAETYARSVNIIDQSETKDIMRRAQLQKLLADNGIKTGKYDDDIAKLAEKFGVGRDEGDKVEAILAKAFEDDSIGVELELAGEEAVAAENKRRLAFGLGRHNEFIANKVRGNSSLMKKARQQFVRDNPGKDFDDADKFTQDRYLMEMFAGKIGSDDLIKANVEYMTALGIKDDDIEKLGYYSNNMQITTISDFVKSVGGKSLDEELIARGLVSRRTEIAKKKFESENPGSNVSDEERDEELDKFMESFSYEEIIAQRLLSGKYADDFNFVYETLNKDDSEQSQKVLTDIKKAYISRKVDEQTKGDYSRFIEAERATKKTTRQVENEMDKNILNGMLSEFGFTKTDENGNQVSLTFDDLSEEEMEILTTENGRKKRISDLSDATIVQNMMRFKIAREPDVKKRIESGDSDLISRIAMQQTGTTEYTDAKKKLLEAKSEDEKIAIATGKALAVANNANALKTILRELYNRDKTNTVSFDKLTEIQQYEAYAKYLTEISSGKIPVSKKMKTLAGSIQNDKYKILNSEESMLEIAASMTDKDVAGMIIDKMSSVRQKAYESTVEDDATTKARADIELTRKSTQIDTSKLSAEERRIFNFNRGLLQQQVMQEGNETILENLFRNTRTLNNDRMVEEMLLAQTETTTLAEAMEKLFKEGVIKSKTLDEAKLALSAQTINDYLSSHEKERDQLLNLGAQDLTLTLNKETQNERRLQAVVASNNMTNEVVKQALTTQYSDIQIKRMIERMLKSRPEFKGKNPDEINNYISKNYNSLLTEVARNAYLQTDKLGRTIVKDGASSKALSKAIDQLSMTNKEFEKSVNKEVTKFVSYGSQATDEEKKEFFRNIDIVSDDSTKHIVGVGTSIKQGAEHLRDSINKYFEGKNVLTGTGKVFADIGKGIGRGASRLGVGIGKGVAKAAVGMWTGTVYKIAKQLPKQSIKYDNWNRVLERKIKDVQSNKSLSAEQKKLQIIQLENRKIYSKMPEAVKKMSVDEQIKWNKQQALNKQEAFKTKSYGAVYKKEVKLTRPKNRNALKKFADNLAYSIDGIPVLRRITNQQVKLKHKQDLAAIEASITRFNATKNMRNKDINFGTNFQQFSTSYMSIKQYNTMVKKYGLMSDADYKKLTDPAKIKAEQKKREDAFALQLNGMHRVALSKVNRDNKVKTRSYLEEKGIETENIRFKDGSRKYKNIRSRVNPNGITIDTSRSKKYKIKTSDGRTTKVSRRDFGKKSLLKAEQAKNDAIRIKNIMNSFEEFNRTYKGDGTRNGYANEVKKRFGDEFYLKYFKKTLGFGDLESSPIAVQQRELAKQMASALAQAQKRLKYGTNIVSARKEVAQMFVGKRMTNAKTATEINIDRIRAEDLNKAISHIQSQKSLSYAMILKLMKPSIAKEFEETTKKSFDKKSDADKKAMLEEYLLKQLKSANNRVNNNNFFKSDIDRLKKLNGIYVNNRDTFKGGVSKTMTEALKTSSSQVYQNLVRNYNSAEIKYKTEQSNMDRILAEIKRNKEGVQTAQSRRDLEKLLQALKNSKIKLANLESLLKTAEGKKIAFERSFADKEVRQARVQNKNFGASSAYRVLDHYDFPIKGAAGKAPEMVKPGSPEGRMVEHEVRKFISTYRGHLDRMFKYFESKDEELKREFYRASRKMTADFGTNLRSLKSMQRKLSAKIDSIAKKNNVSREELLKKVSENKIKLSETDRRVIDYSEELSKTEKDLIGQLSKLGIDVKKVSLKK